MEKLPEKAKEAFKIAKEKVKSSEVGSYLVDMWYSSTAITISIFMGLIYTFLFIWFMSIFGKFFSWLAVFLSWFGLVAGSYMCWITRQKESQSAYTLR
jgi:hypothetical protein